MDDSCAVCADSLEWVAYGPCGHREVCSTCVARLRFICNDRRCCICKTESDVVFVTKALGDYTRTVNDFSVFPSTPREGEVGSNWYHEDTQAFFDDRDHYNMVKAMCRLSCSVCDQVDEQSKDVTKKKAKFRNIVQLKNHLFHRHKLVMCSLCLEGRKIFICEQKLYTRAQLNQHIHTGDSEVDGSENDRGGFAGHPKCAFCRNAFYGDNELYTHMSTEHYTCHICQRQHPTQYDYYKNYDDLEIHFRRDHFICEDEACLAKKFVVFQSEAEMKRHNATEHGGRMSRAQRNAALQIPTSFRYRRSTEQDHRRGRRAFDRESSEDQLSIAVEASLQMINLASSHDPLSSSNAQVFPDLGDTDDVDPIVRPYNATSTADSEPQSGYLQAISKSRNVSLEESSFPPLPVTSSNTQQNHTASLPSNTLANRLRRNMDGPVLNSEQPSPSSGFPNLPVKMQNSRELFPSLSSSIQAKPAMNSRDLFPSLSSSVQAKPATNSGASNSGYVSSSQAWSANGQGPVLTVSSKNSNGTKKITHSASAPDLVESRSVDSFASQFPPIPSTQMNRASTNSSEPLLNVENVQSANKSLVEKMRAALEFDEEKYNAFKEISGQYRQGLIDTVEYLGYVQQFGLSHLVLDLARLCPDHQKQKELLDTYNTNMRSNNSLQNVPKKGKGKQSDTDSINPNSSLADSILNTVRELQSRYTPSDVAAEELSKDGYRSSRATAKGKSMVIHEREHAELRTVNQITPKAKEDTPNYSTSAGGSNQNTGNNSSGSKQQKKTSKFHRLRLGDGSVEAYLNARKYDSDPEPELPDNGGPNPDGPPVRGVWRRGGGQKLFGTGRGDLKK